MIDTIESIINDVPDFDATLAFDPLINDLI